MLAPKCKICGKSHWANEPHALTTDEIRGIIAAARIPEVESFLANPDPKARAPRLSLTPDKVLTVVEAVEQFPPAPKFDKVAYQREYMRKRREKGKR